MTDTMNEELDQSPDVAQSPSPPLNEAALGIALHFIAVAADPREARKRLRGYYEALTAADAAQKNLVAAQTEFAVHEEKTRAELGKREAAARSREVAASVAEENLRDREAELGRRYAEQQRADNILKRRAMLVGRLDPPGPLQDMPNWRALAAELAQVENLVEAEPEMETINERPSGLPPDVSLTRTVPTGRRSMRRVSLDQGV